MGSGSAAPLPKAGAVLPLWSVWAWRHTGHGCRHPLPGPSPKGITLRGTRRGSRLRAPGDCLWYSFSSQPGCVLSPFHNSTAITPSGPCALCSSLAMRAPPPVGSWTPVGWRGDSGKKIAIQEKNACNCQKMFFLQFSAEDHRSMGSLKLGKPPEIMNPTTNPALPRPMCPRAIST